MTTIAIDLNDVIRDFTRKFILTYQKEVDGKLDVGMEDVKDFDFSKMFPFKNKREYERFRYEDYAYELHCMADLCEQKLPMRLNRWIETTIDDLDEGVNIIIFSPLEVGMTIQATLAFLSRNMSRFREYYFPVDSQTIYDRADIVITANPNLIQNVPEGKRVVKISTSYNEGVEAELTYASLMDVIEDEEEKIVKIIENNAKKENQ